MRAKALAATLLLAASVRAQDGVAPHRHGGAPADSFPSSTSVSGLQIPDVVLLNQHGDKVRLYSDLIEGRVAAINTIFTTCTTICPVMGANFAKLQKSLDSSGRRDVSLISISVDPVIDTPQRLEEWMRGFGAYANGWTVLTGTKDSVDQALKALRVFKPDKNEHTPVILIGGDKTGDWVRASALLPPARLLELIDARIAASHTGP